MKAKNILAPIIEGVVVGVIISIVMSIVGIEATGTQIGIVVASALIVTTIASAISQAVVKGESPYKYEWAYTYGENRIVVIAGLSEELYINDELVDKKSGIKLKAELEGQLKTGEKVKVSISGGMTAKCELFVGNVLLEPIAIKTP